MATPDFTIKQNSLLPVLTATLSDANGAVNLTGATVAFHLKTRDGVLLVNRACTVGNQTTNKGQVTYTWQAGDTATSGSLLAEFEVTWPGSTPEYFPTNNLIVQINANLA